MYNRNLLRTRNKINNQLSE